MSAEETPAGTVRQASVHEASAERGRIAATGGAVNLIWLAVPALMVWRP